MKIDGRKLSHAQLEAIRFQAVKAVQAGQPPTAVARVLESLPGQGICVVSRLSCWRMGCASRAQGERASEAVDGVSVEMDLQYRDIEKSASALFPLRSGREGDDRHADSAPGITLSAISVGRLLAQMGLSCQKPLSRAFEQDATLVKQWIERDFPKIRALAEKRACCRVFCRWRAACDLTFMPGRPGGYAGKTPVVRHTGKRFHLNMLSAISAKGELRFMTSRKRLSRRCSSSSCAG